MRPDPEIQSLLDQIALLAPPPAAEQTPDEIRAAYEMFSALSPRADDVSINDRVINGPGGDLPLRLYRPDRAAGVLPALVYFHGGGHVIGSIAGHDGPASFLAAAGGFAVVSVDYRLAPEHPFPADVEDADAALAWVAERAGELGIDPACLGVGGDSAGANLAAVAALHARDGGRPPLAAQLLIYPWVDLACARPSMEENATGYLLLRADLEHWRSLYAPDVATWSHPDASAICADDLGDLPPAVVVTCAFDPLRDQGDEYAARLEEAGVDVRHLRYPDLVHTFIQLTAVSERARAATEELAREVSKLLTGASRVSRSPRRV